MRFGCITRVIDGRPRWSRTPVRSGWPRMGRVCGWNGRS